MLSIQAVRGLPRLRAPDIVRFLFNKSYYVAKYERVRNYSLQILTGKAAAQPVPNHGFAFSD